jgi:DNA-directed RNA polymerase subunit K/omega
MSDETRELTVRESIDSKFRYVLLVAERAEQLMRGARAKLDISGAKATHVAREEIDQRVVEWDYGLAPEPELEALIEVPAEEGEEAAEAEENEDAEAEVH